MTRAKDDLHLIVPQRFFTHGQHAQGDRHVYASRTRFIPKRCSRLFETHDLAAGRRRQIRTRAAAQGVRMDINSRMRAIWR